MEEAYIENSVRTRLIIAGINEIEERGIKDFSLRRAALAAQVSCAAPYRHFRDKDEFISEIIKYVASRWELLCKEIRGVFNKDPRRLIIELSVANLRFWIANPNYRSVLMTAKPLSSSSLSRFEAPLMAALSEYVEAAGIKEQLEMKKYTLRALIYGSLMLTGGEDNRISVTESFREKLEQEFPEI